MISSDPTQNMQNKFDTGPLSWVMAETRDALMNAKRALHEAIEQSAESQSTLLKHAKIYLHQAHGALQMVDVDGVAKLSEIIEVLLDRMSDGQLTIEPKHTAPIEQALDAIQEYLEALLVSGVQQPVRLFPYYRDLSVIKGVERINPVDLFFPNLIAVTPITLIDDGTSKPQSQTQRINYTSIRQRFELSLLPFLKQTDEKLLFDSVKQMQELLAEIWRAQTHSQSRSFWGVMHGFVELIADQRLFGEQHVKQMFGCINLQIRRLVEGAISIPESLMREALFFIARAERLPPNAANVRQAYQLDGQVPVNFEVQQLAGIESGALAIGKERLGQIKTLWGKIAHGESVLFEKFEQKMKELADVAIRLKSPPLTKLVRELTGISRHVKQKRPSEAFALEMATGLLFIDSALDQISHLPANFSERAGILAARLLSLAGGDPLDKSAPWIDEMSQKVQQRQTMEALVSEMQSSFRIVEKTLDDYFREPTNTGDLVQIDPIMHQISGALAILDQEEANLALMHTQELIHQMAQAVEPVDSVLHTKVAQNIGAMSFLIEALVAQPETAKNKFSFDRQTGYFKSHFLDVSTPLQQAGSLDEAAQLPAYPPMPASDDAIDAELLEVFLTEAEEVIASVNETLPLSRNDPVNQDYLITLRRSFHTLKGSGRMVGLSTFGNAAWAIEQVMNGWLVDAKSASEDLYALLEKASEILGNWVGDLSTKGVSEANGRILIAAAEHFKNSGTYSYQENGAKTEQSFAQENTQLKPVITEITEDVETHSSSEFVYAVSGLKAEDKETLTVPEINFDFRPLNKSPTSDLTVPESSIEELEADSHERKTPSCDVKEFESELIESIESFIESARTLNPASQDDKAEEVIEQPDGVVQAAKIIEFPAGPSYFPTFEDNVKKIGDIEIGVPLYNIYLAETDEIVRFLSQDFSEWRHELHRPVTRHAVHATHSLAGSSATVGLASLQEVAHALEMVLQRLERHPVRLLPGEFDTLDRCIVFIKEMLLQFALAEMPSRKPEQILVLEQLLGILTDRAQPLEHDLSGIAFHVSDTSRAIETVNPGDEHQFLNTRSEIGGELESKETPDVSGVSSTDFELAKTAVSFAQTQIDETKLFDASVLPKDDIDADLLPIFLEEGSDLFPLIGQTFRAWQVSPQDNEIAQSLLRLLHTVKGSARMAGAMALGQHTHDMESQIENLMQAGPIPFAAVESLLMHHDSAMAMFEQLRNPGVSPATPDIQSVSKSSNELIDSTFETNLNKLTQLTQINTQIANKVANSTVPATNIPLVRVRADILDRLVNQAGEVSISRSRLENEVSTLRSSLFELNENVGRLRDQLREVEIQAETQISSRMALSGEREFDPLEFDRFTRLQELTRMMAESVSDVSALQVNISKTVEGAADDLHSQARLTRELQRDLMRVRMIPFASISERLYRITRQTSKDLDKRVNLDIRGTSVEIDRSVLEKMAGPFEHLLRNAIVHGIEARERRQALGKNEIGEILVQIRQEGNEVVINFNDDGRGLDLKRIREKAHQTGLLAVDEEVTDAEASNLIFQPGFSTAQVVTELAGRGVGMDVVRSEAALLGGRVSVSSIPDVGSSFTIHLPLTLAVTQVVLLSCGNKTYAVPSVLVEQVQQLKTRELASAHNDGAIMWQGQRVPMHYLSTVLADYQALPISQQYTPIVIARSGEDRVALHVDQVVGNREVIVKNIGQQLSRMPGISGATVLGSGDIVLILNPIPLAQKIEHQRLRAPRLLQENIEHPQVFTLMDQLGAISESQPATSQQPVQGLRRPRIVMVVDDSLTVRKVTQRLLLREGYQVVLAKDGVDALQQLQAITPDVMLLDIEMPRMDGFDLTRNIRNDERLNHIPIIMITSRTADKHRNYALELGVNAYFGKPFREDMLLNAILGFLPQTSVLR